MAFGICTVGCGRHARRAHGPSYARYAQRTGTQLISCCDIDAARAEDFARDFGFDRFDIDLDTMLDRENPDAICLVAPPPLTCALACRILPRGVPLLLEKPPGIDMVELERVIGAAGNTPVMVAFNRRFAPGLVELRRCIAGLEIHEIDYLMIRHARSEPDFSKTAIHGVDALRFLVGDFHDVRLSYQPIQNAEPACNIVMEAQTPAGARVRYRCYPCGGGVFERAAVQAEGVCLEANVPMWNSHDMPGVVRAYEADQCKFEVKGDPGDPEIVLSGFYGVNEAFFEAVRAGRPPTPTVVESRLSMRIADAIRRRAIRLDEE